MRPFFCAIVFVVSTMAFGSVVEAQCGFRCAPRPIWNHCAPPVQRCCPTPMAPSCYTPQIQYQQPCPQPFCPQPMFQPQPFCPQPMFQPQLACPTFQIQPVPQAFAPTLCANLEGYTDCVLDCANLMGPPQRRCIADCLRTFCQTNVRRTFDFYPQPSCCPPYRRFFPFRR